MVLSMRQSWLDSPLQAGDTMHVIGRLHNAPEHAHVGATLPPPPPLSPPVPEEAAASVVSGKGTMPEEEEEKAAQRR